MTANSWHLRRPHDSMGIYLAVGREFMPSRATVGAFAIVPPNNLSYLLRPIVVCRSNGCKFHGDDMAGRN